ncbi:tetratricopeptide repeat protein [Geomonas anaerohicana]|uniref:NB-ARC domain-containing protein n=1 Tax=Geomonas anaerohicana TaxID=2798583 RepID=A0ABS0Y9R3_9BACT|nr:NB-ARC domain-containing protein [Geomonas anaerohicana]MBJ6749017.1 hypothetical protein [Geomonas anaerohicana]
MKISEARLTLYALISALESDLKAIIQTQVIPCHRDSSFIVDKKLRENATSRFAKDYPGTSPECNFNELVHYLDFQDSYKVILQNREILSDEFIMKIQAIVERLDLIVPIRNRVMHNRPLLHGDLGFVYGFAQDISADEDFNSTRNVLHQIESDPTFILTVDLPRVDVENEIVYNNLPIPDFDETGFIGRKKDTKEIIKLLLGSTRVVSVIGEGGIGKSALMLKVAYDIVDMSEICPFDMVLWTTAKTTMLTPAGIVEIKEAIDSFPGIVRNLASHLNQPQHSLTDNIQAVMDVMQNFKCLLIIDNLETIISEEIKEFIREAQLYAKIAITSRVGLGELEYPRHLEGLTEIESVTLMREASKMRNDDVLLRLPTARLSDIAKKLHYNPLALKWFINSVASGQSPDQVLLNKDSLLEFCLSNVFDKMSASAKKVLQTMLAARTELTEAEIIFYSDIETLELKRAIISLISTSFVKRQICKSCTDNELLYSITEFAREYLLKYHAPDKEFIDAVTDKKNKLVGATEQGKITKKYYEFGVNAIEARNSTETIAASYLQQALQLSRQNKCEPALEMIKVAKNLAPGYFEVYRLSAFIKAMTNDVLGAEEDYRMALEIEPDNARLNYFYSGFLLRSLSDSTKATEYIQKAYLLRPDVPNVVIEYARNLVYQGSYDEGIALLEKVLKENPDLPVRTSRIAGTLLINSYRRYAEKEVILTKNTGEAFKKLLSSINVFKLCGDMRVIDQKLIDEFGNTVSDLIRIISEKQLKHLSKFVHQIYSENKKYLDKSAYLPYILRYIAANPL